MTYALDHVFVCCAEGAPEAARLTRLGFAEGSSNTHPGQGTASRRFFFENAYLELFWVTDAREAQAGPAARTRLWSRWSARGVEASPFAIILRPDGAEDAGPPFASWAYHPSYLPPPLAIHVAEGTPLGEPAFFYLGFARGAAQMQPQPRAHDSGVRRMTAVEIGLPGTAPRSAAAQFVEDAGLVQFVQPERHRMTITFDDGHRGEGTDLRPDLPLVLRW
jgi:hypothetical protein